MKRILTGVALASTAMIISAGPALAAPVNPVAPVQKQFVAGHGVKFAESVKIIAGGQRQVTIRRSGSLEFGPSGVIASDVTGQFNIKKEEAEKLADALKELGDEDFGIDLVTALTMPERIVTKGQYTYLTGGLWSAVFNSNKSWIRVPGVQPIGATTAYSQPLNILSEPATLKTLLKGAKATKDGYAGKIQAKDLSKTSPLFGGIMMLAAPAKSSPKAAGAISWKLAVDAKGLPTRLVSVIPATALGVKDAKGLAFSVETTFSDWGTPVTVTAPPELEVAKTLDEAIVVPGPKTLPLSAIAH
ncbi:hypothetical protein GCM10010149_73200 [Nonomuraea roseoviolacea subsp. roseoviolacea]|uniref:DUF2092 domain-containing protein n=1 Tax=Nonomuraea roseoviolacea subsp. carminata TaxID=160689 RepID=A0ABT1JWF3_9ACTN|nr:hypothetical protein [Nonomuraea roseoviolacea]MCP2346097.1 hypothetical protein [Nonomuraea roseoviolacea subsp. carminata]